MQTVLLLIGIMLLMCTIFIVLFAVYLFIALYRIADKLEITLPFMEKYKEKLKEERENEEKDKKYNQFLEELSKKSPIGSELQEANAEYDELDSFDQVNQTENEPESIMQLLEFGIPDVELETLLNLISEKSN